MVHFDLDLLLIPLVAVLAPLLTRGLGRWVRIPVVVFELVLGILIGPSVLGWAFPSDFVSTLSQLGLAMLFFVAGTEIDFQALRGRSGSRAGIGWLISVAVGVAVGFLIAPGEGAVIVGIALASTALGTLLPILRDAGELKTPFGKAVSALGTVGEFGPLLAISIFLGTRAPGRATIVLAVFLLIAAGVIWYAFRAPQGRLHDFVTSTMHTSGQFAVRIVIFLIAALAFLSIALDIDMLLGAFIGGVVWRLMLRDADEQLREHVESKIEAVAFGFLVPVFFVYTGVTFDLASLLKNPVLLALVPVALILLLIVRGLPSMLAAPVGSKSRDRFSIALLGATGLPIIVAVTGIGVDKHLISSGIAAVLVGAGMLSVLLFPLIGMSLRGERDLVSTVEEEDSA
ncbi:cation:proton antiporter [Microbacterium sp. ASV49]|uniref:Cation:proton antiporter n=1 Tax=Microbacterium candidum TaxID=3041922 RepID=A0ABT7MVN1_9MICO|nr:cation:proton antiporter [Microbacterium sp. ASV49]MDL9978506.1 cation:proton antiporter [Microbacterium sp. ASV49]